MLIKDIRDTIVHEYIEDNLLDVFEEVLEYSEKLITIINTTISYINRIEGVEK